MGKAGDWAQMCIQDNGLVRLLVTECSVGMAGNKGGVRFRDLQYQVPPPASTAQH